MTYSWLWQLFVCIYAPSYVNVEVTDHRELVVLYMILTHQAYGHDITALVLGSSDGVAKKSLTENTTHCSSELLRLY